MPISIGYFNSRAGTERKDMAQTRRMEETDRTKKTTEDYLEAILQVYLRQGYVRSVDVALQLGVSKPSVTYAAGKLREKGYLTTDKAGMLVLTDSGKEIAGRTLNRHQVLTSFLEHCGVSSRQAQIDACQAEHDLCEDSFQAIERLVKNGFSLPEGSRNDSSRRNPV